MRVRDDAESICRLPDCFANDTGGYQHGHDQWKRKSDDFQKTTGPSDNDSAIIGGTKDARMPATHTAAFLAMSFFLSAFVMVQAFPRRVPVTWEFGSVEKYPG